MDRFQLDESLGYILNNVSLRTKQTLRHTFKQHGHDITPEQWALLNRLWEEEGVPQVELADRTFKDKPNLTRMIDVLEKKGLVERRKDESDRRAYNVYLTASGRALQDQLTPLAAGVLARIQQDFSHKEIAQLKSMLKKIYNNLE